MSTTTNDETALEAFRWSLGLISNILVRTIIEGSTIVMKAIDANSGSALRKAVSHAPRGERTHWLLTVQVGTQSISPFYWAIKSACFEAAGAIIEDLLTIRADRERYYYGVDDLFSYHPDVVQRLLKDAPSLLHRLWSGLVWRCRTTDAQRMRRVNYYIKHLIVDREGRPSSTIKWLVDHGDPGTMTESIIVELTDLLWQNLCLRRFLVRKMWYIASLIIFMLSQVILPKLPNQEEAWIRYSIFGGRCINYGLVMTQLIMQHSFLSLKAYLSKDTVKVCKCFAYPAYLGEWYQSASFSLMWFMIAMLVLEPMVICISNTEEFRTGSPPPYMANTYQLSDDDLHKPTFPTEICANADDVMTIYSSFCVGAMFIQWLLIVDMVVFSTDLSAFGVVVKHVLAEIGRFLIALGFLLLTFGSAISILEHDEEAFQNTGSACLALFAITVKLYQDDYRGVEEPALIVAIFCYQTAVTILLLNLLIAQLQCSYEFVYQDAIGFARLARSAIIAETIDLVPPQKWNNFVASCKFDQRLEFNEGDVGIAGGIQVLESVRQHPIVEETILRFGGSCSPEQPWPEESNSRDSEEDKFERIERLLVKSIKRMANDDEDNVSGEAGKVSTGSSKSGATEDTEESGDVDM